MRIVIIDTRKGLELRPDAQTAVNLAALALYIEPDNHVRVEGWSGNHQFEFYDGVHCDVISAERSAEMLDKRTRKKAETDKSGDDPLTKFSRVWEMR